MKGITHDALVRQVQLVQFTFFDVCLNTVHIELLVTGQGQNPLPSLTK